MTPDPLPLLEGICLGALVAAVMAGLGERRRRRRLDPDAVGFMPWRTIAFWAMLLGLCAGGIAIRLWLTGG